MIRLAAILMALAGAAQAEMALSVMEVRTDADPARLRLLAQGDQLTYDAVADQFDIYCAQFADELAQENLAPTQIVVSISDRFVPFGDTVPDAVQFFELYDVVDTNCVWRAY